MNEELVVASTCHRCFLAKSSRDHVLVVPSSPGTQDYHRLLPALFKDISTISTKSLLKLVHELSGMLSEHYMLLRLLGTPQDGLVHRSRISCLQTRFCQMAGCIKTHFADAFKSMDVLSRADLAEMGKDFRIFLSCIHSFERGLRQSLELYKLFVLYPVPEGGAKPVFIQTGTVGGMELMFSSVCESLLHPPSEQYRQERENWRHMEKLIKEIKELDLSLHMDSVLGPIVDYVIFHPEIEEPSSNLEVLSPPYVSSQESLAFKEKPVCRLICYIVSIFLVGCIGGGVLIAVFFILFL